MKQPTEIITRPSKRAHLEFILQGSMIWDTRTGMWLTKHAGVWKREDGEEYQMSDRLVMNMLGRRYVDLHGADGKLSDIKNLKHGK